MLGKFKNKWILNFEGGGWCGSSIGQTEALENCLGRSKMELGSSSKYPSTWIQWDGILADNPLNEYRDWSKAQLKYCTGTGHQGYRKDPILYKGTKLYFRGHNVTTAQLDSLHTLYGIFSSATTDIIVAGQSAGGLAAFSWANYIKDRAWCSTKVISLSDSAIFLDFTKMATGKNQFQLFIKNLMKIVNKQVNPPTAQCTVAYPSTQWWKCMFAEYIYAFIKVPIFVIQSPYDNWSIKQIAGVQCKVNTSLSGCSKHQLDYIEQYRAKTLSVLRAIVAKSAKNGYWLPSCSFHVLSFYASLYDKNYRIPCGSQNSIIKAVAQWEKEQPVSHQYVDKDGWPTNLACSGIHYSVMGFQAMPQNYVQILFGKCIQARQNKKNSSLILKVEFIVLVMLVMAFIGKLINSSLKKKKKPLFQAIEEQLKQQKQPQSDRNVQTN